MRFGYNHRIAHGGRVFDIQSEDSGWAKKHIYTHVFHDGVIVASRRVDYGDANDSKGIGTLMKESHKAMMRALVGGHLDEAIGCNVGASAAVRARPAEGAITDAPVSAANGRPTRSTARARETSDRERVQRQLLALADDVAGTVAVALVELEGGRCLTSVGTGLDVDVLAAGHRDVVRAQLDALQALGGTPAFEDLLITTEAQHHLVRPVDASRFLLLVIDRERGTLARARHALAKVVERLSASGRSSLTPVEADPAACRAT